MTPKLKDIHSLTDFQRNTREHLARMQRSGRPVVLTVNGKAALVVQDAAAYQKLLDAVERAETVAGIRRGLDDKQAGRVEPAEKAFDDIRNRRKIPRRV
jgi:prevent-host-death family protein